MTKHIERRGIQLALRTLAALRSGAVSAREIYAADNRHQLAAVETAKIEAYELAYKRIAQQLFLE